MIPPKIHYCWFGKNSLPETALKCLQSWEEILPEYEIKRWDESHLVLDCVFVRKAYQQGRWAFVSDYMRLLALYREGGIYMDTDMLMLRNLDPFRKYSCFLGFENDHEVNGAIIGARAGNPFIQRLIKCYQEMTFDISRPVAIPKIISGELKKAGVELNNQLQTFNDISIFPTDYFYPLPQHAKGKPYERYVTKNSYTVHLWDYSWMSEFSYFWKGNYREGFQKTWQTLRKSPLQPVSYYKDLLYHLSRYFRS